MANDDVRIKFSSETGEAQRGFADVVKGFFGIEQGAEKSAKATDKFFRGFDDIDRISLRLTGISSAVDLVGRGFDIATRSVRALTEEMRRLDRETLDINVRLDEAAQALTLQMNLTRQQEEQAKRTAAQIASEFALRGGAPAAMDVASALAESGIADQAILSGTAVRGVVQALVAGGANVRQDIEIPKAAGAIGQFVRASGQQPTVENFQRAGALFLRLFDETRFQFSFAESLAGRAGVLNQIGGLTPEQQAGLFGTAAQTIDPARAATGLAGMVQRLAQAGSQPAQVNRLRAMGLTPEQVDLQGEDIFTVLQLFRDVQERDPAMFARVGGGFFGTEQSPVVTALLQNLDQARRLSRPVEAAEREAVRSRARRGSEGIAAEQRRRQANIERGALAGDARTAVEQRRLQQEADLDEAVRRGLITSGEAAMTRFFRRAVDQPLEALGVPEGAINFEPLVRPPDRPGLPFGLGRQTLRPIGQRLEEIRAQEGNDIAQAAREMANAANALNSTMQAGRAGEPPKQVEKILEE